MHGSRLVRVWADIVSQARCKWCRKAIVWRTTFDGGRTLPFNATGTSYGIETDDRGRRAETLCWNDKHACAERPKTPRPPERIFR